MDKQNSLNLNQHLLLTFSYATCRYEPILGQGDILETLLGLNASVSLRHKIYYVDLKDIPFKSGYYKPRSVEATITDSPDDGTPCKYFPSSSMEPSNPPPVHVYFPQPSDLGFKMQPVSQPNSGAKIQIEAVAPKGFYSQTGTPIGPK